jgi:ABC-type phosphate/phosphonate transport system substrate-binding protein
MPMPPFRAIACSRMYNLSPAIRAAWDELFVWLGAEANVDLDIVAHAAPLPLSELWARPDMGAVFMCGYPFSRLASDQRPTVLAAPVSSQSWAEGRPLYASHILVVDKGPITTTAQLMTARWGWTVRDSQSGYHAPRAYLATRPDAGSTLPDAVGPLLNPTGIVAALRDGRIEAGAIDAYAHQLLSMHEPQQLSGLQIVATTASVPAPMLVSAQNLPAQTVASLRQTLLRAHESAEGRGILERLGLLRWSAVDLPDYDQLPERADAADRVLAFSW